MMRGRIRWLAVLMLLCVQQPAFAQPDARMQIDVMAKDQGVELRWLHANISKAADMALPQLWQRIVPKHALNQLPKHVKAVRFLKKAVPNEQGVSILFSEKRVLSYLKQNHIPYYAEQSSETALVDEQVSPQVASQQSQLPLAQSPLQGGLLTVLRQASLPEQVLFEDDLAHDPRTLSLTPRQVNRDRQQYRLQLKSLDDLWLIEWFRNRGLTLTQSVEGWVAQ